MLTKNVNTHFKLKEFNKLKQINTKGVFSIKINITIEINSNSFFSADRREKTGDLHTLPEFYRKKTFHVKIRWLATLQSKEVLKENKEGKHFSCSGKLAKKKKDWKKKERQMKRQVNLYKNVKLGDYFLTIVQISKFIHI